MLKSGDRVNIAPYREPAEVLECRMENGRVVLRVLFLLSNQVTRFVFTSEEFAAHVQQLPSLWEDFLAGASPTHEHFVLFADALRMQLAYTFDPHYAVSVTQVDLLPHQVDAVYRHILPQPRIRFLLADDPGLGKTITAGLVLKELKARDAARRILLVVPAHLREHWKREMNDWFQEDFVPFQRDILQGLSSPDFFERNQQIIISLDFARQQEVRQILARTQWDLVIVDEAHKLSATRYGKKLDKTQRYQLGELLAPRTTHLLFLTATPHKGDDHAYFLLLNLLEPRLFANPNQLKAAARSDGLPFVLRRSKEQVTDLEGRPLFRRREVATLSVALTESERRLYDAVTTYVRRWYTTVSCRTDRKSRNVALALTVLQRRLSSSLYAVRESLRRRKSKLQNLLAEWERQRQEEAISDWDDDDQQDLAEMASNEWESFHERLEGVTAAQSPEELRAEIEKLDELIRLAVEAEKAGDEAKLKELHTVIEKHLRHHPDEKLLIFTEFKDTLTVLKRRIQQWGFPCAIIHGQMNFQARIEEERRFRDEVPVMIATDAAGEGINLQFCRLMVNYDLPWNPNRLEQRMGRIHRYGQQRDCFIFNIIYTDTREGHVLSRLLEKLERMRQRLGDTVYNVIGTLLEDVRLEELIMIALLNDDEPALDRLLDVDVEQRVEEFHKTLEDNALAGHSIDLSAVQRGQTSSLLQRLVPWDVERFTRLAVRTVGGHCIEDRRPGVYRLSIPREFLKTQKVETASYASGLRVAFDRKTARSMGAEYLAPGHTLFDALVAHFLDRERPVRAILLDEKGREGTVWLYRVRLQDGRGEPVLERVVALLHDRATDDVHQVDPRMLWELSSPPPTFHLPPDALELLENGQKLSYMTVLNCLEQFQQEAKARRMRECSIRRRWLTASYNELIRQSEEKLFDYNRRHDEGEDMSVAIRQEDEHYRRLLAERDERLNELENEQKIFTLEPQVEAVALILSAASIQLTQPASDTAAKQRVEVAGMHVVMDYERSHGREPNDVSQQFLGYDIVSSGAGETRYIEVKSFATTGPVELTPHEWQMAQRLQGAYWLYVVENALTEPRLHTLQNPAVRLKAQPVVDVVKVVIENWREGGQP
ncbi:MAG: DUF3883 domain-containing protein [Candidatus Hydrogenedentota bacterium]|nr:MAG: DUF3883 domain-containing protein [Candidatus Hydrogenedentota bacterium]